MATKNFLSQLLSLLMVVMLIFMPMISGKPWKLCEPQGPCVSEKACNEHCASLNYHKGAICLPRGDTSFCCCKTDPVELHGRPVFHY
ncbi:hypothetical protein EUTSA_v10003300mg [Eutrema salsugineum]|uniref:Knottin scorpion toxin-like domain-containing protein n=1 Tax=Eutrema salsugineum TaxID=72664 RepID=V4NEY1_EUTSA|nr:hypothetical protein EUTSA_v10003300mg [Eutrema salsugineum]